MNTRMMNRSPFSIAVRTISTGDIILSVVLAGLVSVFTVAATMF